MGSRVARLTVMIGVLLLGGCATSEQWSEWRGHSSHFASGQHMAFSVRNTEGSAPRVSRRDVDASGRETWWGKAITVSPDQIFQN